MGKEIPTSNGRYWIDDALGILRADIARGAVITVAGARECLQAVRSLSADGKRYPHLVDITKAHSIERDARVILGGPEAQGMITALALLSKTPIGNIMANFFLRLNVSNSSVPTRLFTSEREAIAWLKGFTQE
jgi:hypothetical protein